MGSSVRSPRPQHEVVQQTQEVWFNQKSESQSEDRSDASGPNQVEQRGLTQDLRASLWDCFFVSIMVGGGEAFLPAFALTLGLSEESAGMLSAIPLLIASTVQLTSLSFLNRVGSARRWVVSLCSVQGLCLLALACLALVKFQWPSVLSGYRTIEVMLYALVTVYWTTSLSAGPAWNVWMSSLVPPRIRAQYFAKRSHIGQMGLLSGLLVAGFVLEKSRKGGWEFAAFSALFFSAMVFRFLSVYNLSRQSEKAGVIRSQKRIGVGEMFHRLRSRRDGKVLGFLLIFAFAVNIAGPYFNPFMLKRLALPYTSYMGLIAAMYIAKMITFSILSRRASRIDPVFLVRWGIVGTAIGPFLWLLSRDYVFLFCLQGFAGVAWGVYELGVMLVLFGTIRDDERASFLSYYNFASAVMVLLGASIGGRLLTGIGETEATYFMIFCLSASARLFSLILFERASQNDKMDPRGSGLDVETGQGVFRLLQFKRGRMRARS